MAERKARGTESRLRFLLLLPFVLTACGSSPKVAPAADAGEAEAGPDASVDAPSDGAADTGEAAPACVAPSAKQVWGRQLFDRAVHAVAVLSENDIWRGDDLNLWHWDGATWTRIFSQTSGYYFDDVLALGAKDVWSLGDTRLRHWDGAVWSDRTPPINPRTVWGLDSSALWALAVVPKSLPNRTTTLRWNGTTWTEESLPTPTDAGAATVLNAIWGPASDDVWAVGHTLYATPSGFNATVMHWDGTGWSESGDAHADARVGRDFVGVGGLSAHDVWAVAAGGAAGGELWHLATGTWTKMLSLPVRVDLAQTPQRAVFWSGCAGTLWLAVGGFVSSNDGVGWASFTKLPSTFLFAMSGLGNQVWIAGNGDANLAGALLRNAPDGAASCGNARLDPGEQCDPPDDVSCGNSCQSLAP